MKRYLFLLLFLGLTLQSQGQSLAIRAFYVESYVWNSSVTADRMPPAAFPWRTSKMTHAINIGEGGGQFITTAPYWGPVGATADSTQLFCYDTGVDWWSRWRDSAHASGMYWIQSLKAVSSTNFDIVINDSATTEAFWAAFCMWSIRKDVDGADLDAETSTQTIDNRNRFFRIGKRASYPARWQSYATSIGKSVWPRNGGKLIIASASDYRGETWMSSSVDSCVDFFDLQAYNFQNMWNGTTNSPWYQTPWAVPPGQACGTCESASLNNMVSSHINIVQNWVNAGWTRSKIVIGFSPSCVAGYTGSSTMGSLAGSQTYGNITREDMLAMSSFGGHYSYDAIAKAPYMSGTATAGNPLGIAAGTQFIGSFTDSTSMKAIIDSLKAINAGGIMLYAVGKDIHQGTANPYLTVPTIAASGAYAASLVSPAAPTVTTSAATGVSRTTATMNGFVNTNGSATVVRFVYGIVSGVYTDSVYANENPVASGSSVLTANLTGLTSGIVYYYKVRAYNSIGNGQGNEMSFNLRQQKLLFLR